MVYWMSDRTKRILDEAHIGVIGFQPGCYGACSAVTIELENGPQTRWMGDVRGMSDDEIDARFAEEVMSYGLAAHDAPLIAVGDELLAA